MALARARLAVWVIIAGGEGVPAETRTARLLPLFRATIELCEMDPSATRLFLAVRKGSDEVLGTCLLADLSKAAAGPDWGARFKSGMVSATLGLGVWQAWQLTQLGPWYDSHVQAAGGPGSIAVERVTVKASSRGQGIASGMLQQAMDKVSQGTPTPFSLATQEASTERLYRKLGFTTVAMDRYPAYKSVPNWFMRRGPAPKALSGGPDQARPQASAAGACAIQ